VTYGIDIYQRLWSKVDRSNLNGCWPWKRSLSHGYGQFALRHNVNVKAYKFAYVTLVGPVPKGLELDHLCRNRLCVNPFHLEPVTRLVNIKRGDCSRVQTARHAARTHCKRGHPFPVDNPLMGPTGRRCRTCLAMLARKYRAQKVVTR
jgi:hypothetical protein